MTFITGGRVKDLRVRPGSVVSLMSLRISESQFPQLQNGDYGTYQTRLVAT